MVFLIPTLTFIIGGAALVALRLKLDGGRCFRPVSRTMRDQEEGAIVPRRKSRIPVRSGNREANRERYPAI